jgi:hypothetical protein
MATNFNDFSLAFQRAEGVSESAAVEALVDAVQFVASQRANSIEP